MTPRLKDQYNKKIIQDLQKEFALKNKLMVPKITKVVLNMGLGPSANDKKILQNCVEDISLIKNLYQILKQDKEHLLE